MTDEQIEKLRKDLARDLQDFNTYMEERVRKERRMLKIIRWVSLTFGVLLAAACADDFLSCRFGSAAVSGFLSLFNVWHFVHLSRVVRE